MYANLFKGAPLGNDNAAGPHKMGTNEPASVKGLTFGKGYSGATDVLHGGKFIGSMSHVENSLTKERHFNAVAHSSQDAAGVNFPTKALALAHLVNAHNSSMSKGSAGPHDGGGSHSSHSEAMSAAHDHIKSKGYEISDANWQQHIAGIPKPGEGKTNRYNIPLHQGGKETNKYAHIQVYNKGYNSPKPYELNSYVDSGKPTVAKCEFGYIFKGAPMGNDNAAGPHKGSGGHPQGSRASHEHAYQKGIRAGKKGAFSTANPFNKAQSEHEHWLGGLDQGRSGNRKGY